MYPVPDTDVWMCWILNVESFETGAVHLTPRLSHHNIHKLALKTIKDRLGNWQVIKIDSTKGLLLF